LIMNANLADSAVNPCTGPALVSGDLQHEKDKRGGRGQTRRALLLTVSRRLKSSKKPSLNPLNFQRVVFYAVIFGW